jgi:hypothetical protein
MSSTSCDLSFAALADDSKTILSLNHTVPTYLPVNPLPLPRKESQ